MATILGARSFDGGNSMVNLSDKSSGAASAASVTQKKTGAYSLRCFIDGNRWTRWAVEGTPSNLSLSVWIHPSAAYTADNKMSLRFVLSDDSFIEFRWNAATHTFDAYVDAVLTESGTEAVVANDWFHAQFYVVIDNAGSIQVKIEGTESINYSGDTQPGAVTDIVYIYARSAVDGTAADYYYLDNMVWGTGGYLGDLRCVDIRPNADTAQDDWTPSAGDNYSTIDETPESDADYNETNTNAHADELDMGNFDGATYVPVATIAWVRAKMLAATGDSIKVGVDSGGTDSVTERTLSTSWEYYFHTDDDNPADSLEWEDADIDALKLHYGSVIS